MGPIEKQLSLSGVEIPFSSRLTLTSTPEIVQIYNIILHLHRKGDLLSSRTIATN
jgi:hypothetical protein